MSSPLDKPLCNAEKFAGIKSITFTEPFYMLSDDDKLKKAAEAKIIDDIINCRGAHLFTYKMDWCFTCGTEANQCSMINSKP